MDQQTTTKELLRFLDASPTSFHAVDNMAQALTSQGFTELNEKERWKLSGGRGYFVKRNQSALIAFFLPRDGIRSFRIIASHSDSPAFKIKENPEIASENHYVQLNTERYGGMIYGPWLDRPLSAAGRIIVRENGRLAEKLVNIDRDLLMIPSLAIHMNPEANRGYQYNPQRDLLPIYSDIGGNGTFMKTVAEAAQVPCDEIVGHDLFLYNRQKASVWGAGGEFLSSGRLDDLQCAFASLTGFLQGEKARHLAVHCVFDNEEVGSGTKQGAASTFLKDVLTRVCENQGMNHEGYLAAAADSFLISADNAHAVHPAHPQKADPINRPYINEGIVIKYNGDQKYCTDALSSAMFKEICREAGVPYQTFTNRSDMAGGSTLGNISTRQVSLNSVDIGLPQLAMHSPYETAGTKDTFYLVQAAAVFFA